MSRLTDTFAALKTKNRSAFIPFITSGDPDYATSLDILRGLPAAGADIIELGMPFTDPSADGPAIDQASQRAIKAGGGLSRTLDMVRDFRADNQTTPIILMGYFNPVLHVGIADFCRRAADAGVDGMIIVDLPPEEDGELKGPMDDAGLHLIRLATPTSDDARLRLILEGASGFLYYVAVAGITGQKSAKASDTAAAVARIKAVSDIPVAVGFGIKTPEAAADVAAIADAAVVGSAIVGEIAARLDADGSAQLDLASDVLAFVQDLAAGVRGARV